MLSSDIIQCIIRRTNADKRKAVLTLLNDEEWGDWSENRIANTCAVSRTLVRAVMNENPNLVEKQDRSSKRKVKRGDQEYTVDTSNIGKSNPSKMPERFDKETGEILEGGTIKAIF